MNKAQISESEKQLLESEIQHFEQEFDLSLPENYKNLILKFNGGINLNDNMILDTLYSLKYGETTLEYAINISQILENNIPREYLPMACTGTGNQITIFIKEGEDDYGKVFLFRYDELKPQKIAETLEELLGSSVDEL